MIIDTSSALGGDPAKLSNKTSQLAPNLNKLFSELELIAGQKLEATVSKISVLTQEERGLLLTLKQNESNPASSKQWEKLLKHPNLKHIELTLNQKLINTLTNAPILKGDIVKLVVTHTGLQLETTIPKGVVESKPSNLDKPTSNPPLTTTPTKQTADTHLLQHKPLPHTTLRHALNTSLPASEKHDKLFTDLSRLADAFKHLPEKQQIQQLAPLIKSLSQLPSKHSLNLQPSVAPTPSSIKRAILNSGLFYEKKAITASQLRPQTPTPIHQEGQTVKPKLNQSTIIASKLVSKSAGQTPLSTTQPIKSNITPEHIQNLVEDDLKGSLIHLSQLLNSSSTQKPNKTDDIIAKLLLNILQPPKSQLLTHQKDASTEQLYRTIQKLVQNSLARVQVHQYRTISNQNQDLLSHHNILNLDIPIKTPDGYSTIFMQLFEPRLKEDKKTEKRTKNTQKKAKWRIFMELEFAYEGALAIELSVCDKKLDATFWAEKESLRHKAEENIQQLKQDLEQKGLDVRDLHCSKSPPPKQKVQMDFSLIDIKT